ncbi:MAG: hypothetical protein WDM89_02125 [Rhizomicrobium sp.]
MREVAGLGFEIRGAEQFGEIAIANIVLHQDRNMRRLSLHADGTDPGRLIQLDRQKATDDWLHPRLGEHVGNLIDAEQIIDVGDRDGRHSRCARQLRQFIGPNRTFQQ